MKNRVWQILISLTVLTLTVTAVTLFLMSQGGFGGQPKNNVQNQVVPITNKTSVIKSSQSTNLTTTTLLFGGDVMLGRTVESNIERYDGSWPLQKLANTMSKSDITIVNLESPLKIDASRTPIGSLTLRGDPKGVASLTEAGVDLVSLANNHIPDMGLTGLKDTKNILDQNEINYVGAGETQAEADTPKIITRNGLKFGFLAYTYGVNSNSPGVYYNQANNIDRMQQEVTTLKQKTDVVILVCHFGIEYHPQPTTSQEQFAKAAIDAGATLVIGAHPHIPEPVENYKNGVIIYSLGNLVFDQEQIDNRNFSALAKFTFTGDKLASLSLLPYQIKHYGQPVLLTDLTSQQKVWDLFNLPSGQEIFRIGK